MAESVEVERFLARFCRCHILATDKMESIQGLTIALDSDQFIKQVNEIGISIIGQTQSLVPADKKLYGLRDVTATVNSIPLETSVNLYV